MTNPTSTMSTDIKHDEKDCTTKVDDSVSALKNPGSSSYSADEDQKQQLIKEYYSLTEEVAATSRDCERKLQDIRKLKKKIIRLKKENVKLKLLHRKYVILNKFLRKLDRDSKPVLKS